MNLPKQRATMVGICGDISAPHLQTIASHAWTHQFILPYLTGQNMYFKAYFVSDKLPTNQYMEGEHKRLYFLSWWFIS